MASQLSNVSVALDKLCVDYENIILICDFNGEVKEKNISDFMSTNNLKSLVKQKTCFKNPDKSSWPYSDRPYSNKLSAKFPR